MSTSGKDSLAVEQFPALAQFVTGYLHEDFVQEHGTVLDARRAFLADADAAERAAFVGELQRFRSAADRLAWRDLRAAFAAFGGAWRPVSRAALDALLATPAERRTGKASRARR
jgi:hypothetical protein